MKLIPAKTIITKTKYGDFWFGVDYNMNLYKGCSHGCIYCDSRSNCYQIEDFDTVRSKENALEILNHELATKRQKGVIGIGAMSDTYNPLEKKYEITRKALNLIEQFHFGVSIDTKSNLILRDIDILKKINKHNDLIIKIKITTSDDDLSKIIEPRVCSSSERFETIKQLSNNGLFVGVLLHPVLPFITDTEENIKSLVKKAYESGAKFIHSFFEMTLRDNMRDYYYDQLDKHFPNLKQKYQSTYGYSYNCPPLNHKQLYKIFTTECEKYGLLYKMEDIIKAYKKEPIKIDQISLF